MEEEEKNDEEEQDANAERLLENRLVCVAPGSGVDVLWRGV